MYRIAQGLKELGESVELILTSPYVRAAQTARVLAKVLAIEKDKIIILEPLAPDGQAEDLIQTINEKYKGVENIALVGHEPYLSRLISLLLSGDPGLPITLKKGAVCRLSVAALRAGRCATLDWLLMPAQLVQIGG